VYPLTFVDLITQDFTASDLRFVANK